MPPLLQGPSINVNKLCRDEQIRYETARHSIDVLVNTLAAFRIPV